MSAYNKDNPAATVQQLVEALNKEFPKASKKDKSSTKDTLARYRIALDLFSKTYREQDWHVKAFADYVLMIPVSLVESIKKELSQQLNRIPTDKEITLASGIVEPQSKSVENFHAVKVGDEFVVKRLAFQDALNKIFVKKDVYKGQSLVPQWVVYAVGHGDIKPQKVAGFQQEDFIALINFLNTRIETKLFSYTSCFSGGMNASALYNDLKSYVKSYKSVDFPIVIEALTDATTSGTGPRVPLSDFTAADITQDKLGLALKFSAPVDFTTFVTRISEEGADLQDALSPIMPGLKQGRAGSLENTPQVLLPGLPWFYLLDMHKKTYAITRVMGETRLEPLRVSNIEKQRGGPIEALLLYAPYVEFPIIFDAPREIQPQLISMIPGNAVHVLEKVFYKTKIAVELASEEFISQCLRFHYSSKIRKYIWIKKFYGLTEDQQRLVGEFREIPDNVLTNLILDLGKRVAFVTSETIGVRKIKVDEHHKLERTTVFDESENVVHPLQRDSNYVERYQFLIDKIPDLRQSFNLGKLVQTRRTERRPEEIALATKQLFTAIEKADIQAVKKALRRGADAQAKNEQGKTVREFIFALQIKALNNKTLFEKYDEMYPLLP